MRIYVASSWRNTHQPAVVERLRAAGHEVYDFRNPAPGNNGFRWSDIDPEWQKWTPEQFSVALEHPIAKAGFKLDMDALRRAEATVLVMPCGRSAHLELGFAVGAGQRTVILLADGEPELMNAMADHVCTNLDDVVSELGRCPPKSLRPKDWLEQFFGYKHLPPHLQEVSAPFCKQAERIVDTLPSNPERTVALRKLLEAKDCAVRALLAGPMPARPDAPMAAQATSLPPATQA